jgi:hypothetical protein
LSTSKMPPQQPDRLLDLGDDGLDFGAHDLKIGNRTSNVRMQISRNSGFYNSRSDL